jgi:ubiquinone/menaquinone biosynthesis C-methylase UbiE
MRKLLQIITSLHTKTNRDYLARMVDEKVACMAIAKKFEKDYWDGDRRYGYGGFKYDGRYKVVAEKLIATYHLKSNAKILDVGCGKAFLLYELKKLLPNAEIVGMDISKHGLADAPKEIRNSLIIHRAEEKYPFKDKQFDLVITITTLHNLTIDKLEKALKEIERVGKHKYLVVESYRNNFELFNLQCWALTCTAFFSEPEWVWLFKHFGYTGDFEFIYFN